MADEDIRLIGPTETLRDAYLQLVEEFFTAGERHRDGDDEDVRRDFAAFIRRLRDHEKGIGAEEGYVSQSVFWLVRGGRVLGTSRLRHGLTAKLEVEGGHIGYSVRPSERGKGYATRMLAMTLARARLRGLRRVLVTCDKDNLASARVIRKNGGRLHSEGPSPRTSKTVQRYWIELQDEPARAADRSGTGS